MAEVSEYRRMLAARAGRKAALAGKKRASCDRERGTIYWDDWCSGYDDGFNAMLAARRSKNHD